ncbi:Nicotinamidase-related amidase [Halobacillus karajensis]|uniref:Hydrolase n=1 Tax=Halobacillus karajensis TaxID=195088 RepID=A0A024P910_9BACI|nr:putative hydrolase [Halobacillus karajensis]CDQ25318.1 putative hydrolase [Halobacillus karajensis]CDQ25959.1 putative hydrolase [Halobacillus karajensis]SEI09999.1 Nicotinamidase-related amidase [Halobacillus karajensis]
MFKKLLTTKNGGGRNNLNAEENIRKMLDIWRDKGWEVIHIQHKSEKPSSVFYYNGEGFPIKDILAPLNHEKVITKTVNSAFIGTNLNEHLKSIHTDKVIIAGLTTPHCVSTTTRMSGNLGYDTYLLSDATAAFGMKDHNENYIDAQTIHDVSLATIHKEFATVLNTQQFIKSIL